MKTNKSEQQKPEQKVIHDRWSDCSSVSLIHRGTKEEQRELKQKEVEQIEKFLNSSKKEL